MANLYDKLKYTALSGDSAATVTLDRDQAQALHSLLDACERFERDVHARTYERASPINVFHGVRRIKRDSY